MTENVLITRQRAAQACVDAWFGRALDFSAGDHCGALAAFALDQLGRRAEVLKGARFTTEKGALKWMKRKGFASILEAVDACGLERRPGLAFALPADLVALPSMDGDPFGASLGVLVSDFPRRAVAWGAGEPHAGIMEPGQALAVWRAV